MTFFSLAEATRRLGIDVKTLHRWLADAHYPLQSHPRDGRKKGISGEQLSLLASMHHRRLASLSQEPPISLPCEDQHCLLPCCPSQSSWPPYKPTSSPCNSRWLISLTC